MRKENGTLSMACKDSRRFFSSRELERRERSTRSRSRLRGTKYLSELKNKRWKAAEENSADQLSETAKLLVKRGRLDLKIVLNKE